MDKYMENFALRGDLKVVTQMLEKLVCQIGIQDHYINWDIVRESEEVLEKIYAFYKFDRSQGEIV